MCLQISRRRLDAHGAHEYCRVIHPSVRPSVYLSARLSACLPVPARKSWPPPESGRMRRASVGKLLGGSELYKCLSSSFFFFVFSFDNNSAKETRQRQQWRRQRRRESFSFNDERSELMKLKPFGMMFVRRLAEWLIIRRLTSAAQLNSARLS